MRFTPAAMAACIQIFSVARRGVGTDEITTSMPEKALVRADSEDRSTLMDFENDGTVLVESVR